MESLESPEASKRPLTQLHPELLWVRRMPQHNAALPRLIGVMSNVLDFEARRNGGKAHTMYELYEGWGLVVTSGRSYGYIVASISFSLG